MKRIVLTSDLQLPYTNYRQLSSHIRFIGDIQPDEVVNIGDLTDYPAPSRWNKGTVGEFKGTVKKDSEHTKEKYFKPLRDVFDGPVKIHVGNHDSRPYDYLKRYAPALVPEDEPVEENPFYYGNLVDFGGFGVVDVGGFYDIAPGWISTHGHLGTPLRATAGASAIAAARKVGKSIIQGHTHRMGHISETFGVVTNTGSHAQTIHGVEIGNMMNVREAGYIASKTGSANWQSGFAVMTVDGSMVKVDLVPMNGNGEFIFEGRRWK